MHLLASRFRALVFTPRFQRKYNSCWFNMPVGGALAPALGQLFPLCRRKLAARLKHFDAFWPQILLIPFHQCLLALCPSLQNVAIRNTCAEMLAF